MCHDTHASNNVNSNTFTNRPLEARGAHHTQILTDHGTFVLRVGCVPSHCS